MEGSTFKTLLVRGRSISRKKGKTSSGRYKSRGKSRLRSTSLGQSTRKRFMVGKTGHHKKCGKSNIVDSSKDSEVTQSTEGK